MVLISFHLMQGKNRSAAFRKLLEGAAQGNAIDDSGEVGVALAEIAMQRRRLRIDGLIRRNRGRRFSPAKLHQHGTDGNAI